MFQSPIEKSPLAPTYDNRPTVFSPAEQYGRSIDRFPRATGAGGGNTTLSFTPPMWLSQASTTTMTVSYATVNGIVPSGGWAGGGNDVGVNVNVSGYASGTYNVYLNTTVGATTGVVSAVNITATSGSVPADTSSASYRLVGTFNMSTGATVSAVSPALAWSQEFVACTPGTPSSFHWGVS